MAGQRAGFDWSRSAFNSAAARATGEVDAMSSSHDICANAAAHEQKGVPGGKNPRRACVVRLRVDPVHGAGIEVSFLPETGYLVESVAEVPGQPELLAGHVVVGVSGAEGEVSLALQSEDEADEALAAQLEDGVELLVVESPGLAAMVEQQGLATPAAQPPDTVPDALPDSSADEPPYRWSPAEEVLWPTAEAATSTEIAAPSPAPVLDLMNMDSPYAGGAIGAGEGGDGAATAWLEPMALVSAPVSAGEWLGAEKAELPDLLGNAESPELAADEWSVAQGPPADGPGASEESEDDEEVVFAAPTADAVAWGAEPEPIWGDESQAIGGSLRTKDSSPRGAGGPAQTDRQELIVPEHLHEVEEPEEIVAPFFSASAATRPSPPPTSSNASEGCERPEEPSSEAPDFVPMPAFTLGLGIGSSQGSSSQGAAQPAERSVGTTQAPQPLPVTSHGVPGVGAATAAGADPTPSRAPPGTPCKVTGLWDWLCEMRLQEYNEPAVGWCIEMGAASLDEVAENIEDLAEAASLKPIERQRVQKWATQLLRQQPAGSLAGYWRREEPAGSAEEPPAPDTRTNADARAAAAPALEATWSQSSSSASPQPVYAARTVRLAMDSRGSTGLDLSWDEEWGILVRRVDPLPGQLGLSAGDYIVAIDGCSLRHRSHADCDTVFKERLKDGVVLNIVTPVQSAAAGAPIPPRGQSQPAQALGRGRGVPSMPQRSPWQLARPGQGRRGGYDANRMWTRFRGPPW